jgi:hypothetical protein
MIVLWAAVALLSLAALLEATHTIRPFGNWFRFEPAIGLGIPTALIGGLLIYQFRDKNAGAPPRTRSRHFLFALVGLLLVQVLLTWFQQREISSISTQVFRVQVDNEPVRVQVDNEPVRVEVDQ